ncbi:hypothetical protein [Thermoplasma sp. Kam2015]|uniref:hypothetical protein n=1 Tax=Thermoplasma sp. Kam2015 TaxID=2094122 RepID=UPI001293FD73|nr:hypothetical protein [Thermoplasma sp. Kam2015]
MMAQKYHSTGLIISAIIVFFFSAILSYIGYWYLIIIPAVLAGLFVFRMRSIALSAIASPVGVFAAMSSDFSYRISQSALFSSIAGIPGGPALPIMILIVLSYLFALIPMAIASSFVPEKIQ